MSSERCVKDLFGPYNGFNGGGGGIQLALFTEVKPVGTRCPATAASLMMRDLAKPRNLIGFPSGLIPREFVSPVANQSHRAGTEMLRDLLGIPVLGYSNFDRQD